MAMVPLSVSAVTVFTPLTFLTAASVLLEQLPQCQPETANVVLASLARAVAGAHRAKANRDDPKSFFIVTPPYEWQTLERQGSSRKQSYASASALRASVTACYGCAIAPGMPRDRRAGAH